MLRSFNTAGPCIPGEHYMLPPERRLGRVEQLIEQRKYFTLHAGRQTGKTTSLMWLSRHLNDAGRWRALWVDLETAREQPDPATALSIVLDNVDRTLRLQHADLARPDAEVIEAALRKPATALLEYLACLSALDERPLVLRFDEADGLVGPAMVGHLAAEGFGYREAGPHLMLMAFLQRIVNGGGRVEREYGLGRGALDLMIFWQRERHAIEVKIRRDSETEAEALDQITRYLDRAGLDHGWLILFDLRKDLPWSAKLFAREVAHAEKQIHIVGC